jgi:hypothetical protein
MTVSYLSFRVPYSVNRECVIVIKPQREAYQAVCVDAATRQMIGSLFLPRDSNGARPQISAAEIVDRIGSYRLASAAVDLEADELADRSRRISSQLRSRRRP